MSETEKTEEFSAKKVGAFLQESFNKGEMKLKHAVGLGQTPNVVPEGEPKVNEAARQVEIGWHPVGGLAGKWFADKTGLGKMITEKVNKYPDPTQHWAVLVGDYVHQLWMDESFHVIYINGTINREEWKTFEVGQTRLNDDAIRRAGVAVIEEIREKQPAYNLISNNCQTYALQLLDAIKASGQKEFGTTLAVYDRMFGPGKVMDLFENPEDVPVEKPAQPEGETQVADEGATEGEEKPAKEHSNISLVSYAQKLMNQHTTQVDAQEKANASDDNVEDSVASTKDADEASRDGSTSTSGKIDKLKEKKDKLMSFFKRK